jgi:hypothetical protein
VEQLGLREAPSSPDGASPRRSVHAPGMFTVEHHVGRLLEARVHRLRTADEVEGYGTTFRAQLARLQPRRGILCADHRPAGLYSPPVTAALVSLFTRLNPVLERAALVTGSANAVLSLQVMRLVREAKNPVRRAFSDAAAAATWLGEVLSAEERARLRVFLQLPPG